MVKHKVASDYDARIWIEGTGECERRLEITPAIAGWDYLSFRTYTFRAGMVIDGESESDEMVMVLLSGTVTMAAAGNDWLLEGRNSVFEGRPHAIYLPPGYTYKMSVHTDADCAYGRAPAEGKLQPRVIRPDAVRVELCGESTAAHQSSHILDPGDAEKLLCTESYISAGNWGGFPLHRHVAPANVEGTKVNAVHYYRINPSTGWALQRLYGAEPGLEEVVVVNHGDAVMIRQSYHPVVAAPGCDLYRLGFIASSEPSWEVEEDPSFDRQRKAG
jgi:5-deoxy-glucuronate isomerase